MGSSATVKVLFEDILVERRASNDFSWASRPYNPSHYFVRGRAKDPKELCQLVISCERVQAAIHEVAVKEGKDEKELIKRAQDVLQEMAHDFHLYTVRWFGYVLSKLGKSHYSSIYVNVQKLDQIKECFQRYPVILLPTHRSYVDFLLLSYVCFTYNLPLPIIAAGMDFMGMMGVAEMLRKAGAFFIRRRFGNDKLYWALISEYVKKAVLHGSHPLEMFVEGTRSRSGKSLYPKIGLLTAIADLVRNREIPDVLILPISMSYDRTLEETLYARELLGQPKPRESTNGLLKGLRWLGSQSYGSMYVNFGEFISVRECLGSSFPPNYSDDDIFSQKIQQIALNVILDHQKHLVLPLFSAVATVLLAKISEGSSVISFPKLMTYMHGFRALILTKGSDFGQPISGETLESNLRFILSIHSSLVICPKNEEHIVKFQIGEDETIDAMKFQHYSNQFLPLVLPYCLLSTIARQSDADGSFLFEGVIMEDYVFLRQLLFEDFIYQSGTEVEEATKAASVFNVYLAKGRKNGHSKQWVSETEELQRILKLALEPFLLSYWGVAKTLSQMFTRAEHEAVEIKQLSKMSQSFLRQLLGTNLPKHYGALSLDTLTNAAMTFIKFNYAIKVKLDGGSFGLVVKDIDLLTSIINRLEQYLPRGSTSTPVKDRSSTSTCDPNSVEEDFSQLLLLRSKL